MLLQFYTKTYVFIACHYIVLVTARCSWYNLVIILSWFILLFLRLTLNYLGWLNYSFRWFCDVLLNFYYLICFNRLEKLLINTWTLSCSSLEPFISEQLFSSLAVNFFDLLDQFEAFSVIYSVLILKVLEVCNWHLIFLNAWWFNYRFGLRSILLFFLLSNHLILVNLFLRSVNNIV